MFFVAIHDAFSVTVRSVKSICRAVDAKITTMS